MFSDGIGFAKCAKRGVVVAGACGGEFFGYGARGGLAHDGRNDFANVARAA